MRGAPAAALGIMLALFGWVPTAGAAPSEEPTATPGPEPVPVADDPDHPLPETMSFDEEQLDIPPVISPAKDTLSGHLLLSFAGSWAWPYGRLERGRSQSDFLGSGLQLSGEASLGLSQTVSMGLWGDYANLGSPDGCSECDGKALGGGLLFRYHLAQGLRFDPWLSAGAGWRTLATNGPGNLTTDYSGPVWLRARAGGDWYGFSGVAFGPVLGFDISSYLNSSESDPESTLNYVLSLGLRVTLDIPGR